MTHADIERLLRYNFGYEEVAKLVSHSLGNKTLPKALEGKILGTLRTQSTRARGEQGNPWRDKFLKVPQIYSMEDFIREKCRPGGTISNEGLEKLQLFPFTISAFTFFRSMTSKQTREFLEEHIRQVYPGTQLDYRRTGQFTVSHHNEDLFLEAGGSVARSGARYLTMSFNANPDTVKWVSDSVRAYYGMMQAVTGQEN